MLKGLRTVAYPVKDLKKATMWYSGILGFGPYYEEDYYVGFNVGGYELGLLPEGEPAVAGSVVYWAVDDIHDAWDRIILAGASPNEEIMHVGGEVYVATVNDPFGNLLGIIQNPNFKAEP
ncbi:VOC family protein [Balneola sp. MJW-20]|uniref:VOC family protein n=1 Tax=Gracilimonas aurantiaca TaxID=3234185 RepID=UPI0034675434